MPVVTLPVYGDVSFPDDMSVEEIQKTIEQDIFKGQAREYGAAEAFGIGAERAATAEIRGGSELLFGKPQEQAPQVETPGYEDPLSWMNGTPLSPEAERSSIAAPQERQLTDLERETQYRLAIDQQPVAAIGGAVLGSVASPSSFAGGVITKNALQGALTVGTFGAVTGGIEPVYEEFGDSRLQNVGFGALVGGGLGAGIGALTSRLAKQADDITKATTEAPDASIKTREQIEAELPKLEPTDNLPSLLSKAPEADQTYVDNILSRYDDDEPIPVNVLNQIADNVEDKNVAALFRGASKRAAEAVPENQAVKAGKQQQAALTSATAEPATGSKALSRSSIQQAEKTGDYRDYLTTSVTRLAQIPPAQFAKMTASDNPYKGQNFKMLISRLGADDPDLQQILGGIQGRIRYERQSGKTFQEITKQAMDEVPENVAIDALLTKKVEEILPPEIYASAIKATGKAVDDLLNAQDLARYARESGSEEAYAVLQSQMSRAASLVSALEGNASNLGRALAYQKTLKSLIDANRELPGYLGGVQC
jgi:hypothetical protein